MRTTVSRLALTANGTTTSRSKFRSRSAEQPVEPDEADHQRQRRVERPRDDQRRPGAAAKTPAVEVAQQTWIQVNFAKNDNRRGDDDDQSGGDQAAAPLHRNVPRRASGGWQQHADECGDPDDFVRRVRGAAVEGSDEDGKDVSRSPGRQRSAGVRKTQPPATRPRPARQSSADSASPVFAPRSGRQSPRRSTPTRRSWSADPRPGIVLPA